MTTSLSPTAPASTDPLAATQPQADSSAQTQAEVPAIPVLSAAPGGSAETAATTESGTGKDVVQVPGVRLTVEASEGQEVPATVTPPADTAQPKEPATVKAETPAMVAPAGLVEAGGEPVPASASAPPAPPEPRHPARTASPVAGSAGQRSTGAATERVAENQTTRTQVSEAAVKVAESATDGEGRSEPDGKRGSDQGEERSAAVDQSGSKVTAEWSVDGVRVSDNHPKAPVAADNARQYPRTELRELPQMVRRAELVARAGGPTEMRVQLVPEHLGRLSIRISISEGAVTARLEVQNPQVKALVEERLPELEGALKEQGLRLGGLSVGCQDAGTQSGGFLREQVQEQLARGLSAGLARRGYDDGATAGVPESPPPGAGNWWVRDGGLVNALV